MRSLLLSFKPLLITAIVVLIIVVNFLPQIEKMTLQNIDRSLERALISFGTAKGLNAIISVAQGTEIAATPAGVGVNFAVGELLDPINDMVERFSWVMLASSVSLGIQKLLTLLFSSLYLKLFLAAMLVVLFYAFLTKREKTAIFTLKIAIFVLILRFSLPIFAFLSQNLYTAFLASSYKTSTLALQETTHQAKALHEHKTSEPSLSVWGTIKHAYKSTAESLNIKKRITELTSKLNETFNHILALITLFIIETIIFPLLFLYLLLKLFHLTALSSRSSDELMQWFHRKTVSKNSMMKRL